MKRFVSVILLMLVIYAVQAQTWGWNKQMISPYAFDANGVKISQDKHVYTCGLMVLKVKIGYYPVYISDQTYSTHESDGYIIKMDTLGNVKWKNKFGGVMADRTLFDVDKNNNAIVASDLTKPYSKPESDTIWYSNQKYDLKKHLTGSVLVKYDSDGNYVWSKTLEADKYYHTNINVVKCDKNNNVYVAGTFGRALYLSDTTIADEFNDYSSQDFVYFNGFIIKYDNNGNRKYTKILQNGPESNVTPISMDADSDGNFYWVGSVSGLIKFDNNHKYDFGTGKLTLCIVKFDPDGNVIWIYKIPGDQNYTRAETILADNRDGIYVGGSFRGILNIEGVTRTSKPGLGDTDCFILKLNKDGKFTWFKQFGSAKEPAPGKSADSEKVNDFYINPQGFIYVTGGLGRGAKMDDVDVLIKDTDQTNIFLAKLDSTGTTQWVKNYGTYYSDLEGFVDGWGDKVISAAVINMDGGIVEYEDGYSIIGDFSEAQYYNGFYRLLNDCNATLKFSNGTLTASAGESYKWFLNGTEISSATEQTFIPDVVGDYKVEVTFSETCKSLSSPVTVSVTSVKGQSKFSAVSLYPNPANSEVYIEGYSGFSSDVSECRIYSSSGTLMKESKLETAGGNYKGKINVSDLQTGLYMLEILTEEGSINKKFVKN